MTNFVADGRRCASILRDSAKDDDVAAVISAINLLTASHRANAAAVMVGCAQVLAQIIVAGGPEIAPDLRLGVWTLIDDFAGQVAKEDVNV